jgi:hypothetical protein
MAVHRKRARKPATRTRELSRVTSAAVISGAGGDLGAAAQIVADEARRLASWSAQIPGRISVSVTGNVATISCDAPPAYPNEIEGVRHPTFGHEPWRTNQHRPFLAPAADAKADAAMARYADKIDTMARKAGFR